MLFWPFSCNYSSSTQSLPAGEALVEAAINAQPVVVFSATYCPYCTAAKDLLADNNIEFLVFELDRGQRKLLQTTHAHA
jgi:glutaredoxin 3